MEFPCPPFGGVDGRQFDRIVLWLSLPSRIVGIVGLRRIVGLRGVVRGVRVPVWGRPVGGCCCNVCRAHPPKNFTLLVKGIGSAPEPQHQHLKVVGEVKQSSPSLAPMVSLLFLPAASQSSAESPHFVPERCFPGPGIFSSGNKLDPISDCHPVHSIGIISLHPANHLTPCRPV